MAAFVAADSGGDRAAALPRHANLGGMDIIERMFLMEQEIPTIIVTDFDYFPAGGQDASETEIISLGDLNSRASSLLGDYHLGTVRYGSSTWRDEFAFIISR
ncbi:hypothetical protein [Enterovirga aerilata]|uniref:Uncharacterized protein n=1 Tax=Enterovirga aerilata TaxID=2730920 RepID=A0A849ID95_9HYPH|nr:hypothetical protein [Enterovirga sp. DB1703]NNM74195.1 hypothetical protein [Enterovirga sp. DB1703]